MGYSCMISGALHSVGVLLGSRAEVGAVCYLCCNKLLNCKLERRSSVADSNGRGYWCFEEPIWLSRI